MLNKKTFFSCLLSLLLLTAVSAPALADEYYLADGSRGLEEIAAATGVESELLAAINDIDAAEKPQGLLLLPEQPQLVITVQAGVPVKWTIHVDEKKLTGCNNAIVIPAYGLRVELQTGDNLVAFAPEEPGTVAFSCWMGMIRSTITVVESLAAEAAATPTPEVQGPMPSPAPASRSSASAAWAAMRRRPSCAVAWARSTCLTTTASA